MCTCAHRPLQSCPRKQQRLTCQPVDYIYQVGLIHTERAWKPVQTAIMDPIWHRCVRCKLYLKAFRIVVRRLVCQLETCVSLKKKWQKTLSYGRLFQFKWVLIESHVIRERLFQLDSARTDNAPRNAAFFTGRADSQCSHSCSPSCQGYNRGGSLSHTRKEQATDENGDVREGKPEASKKNHQQENKN